MGQNKIELDTQLAGIEVIDTQESRLLIRNELTNSTVSHRFLSQPFVRINSDVIPFFKILNQRNSGMEAAAANLQHL